MNKQQTTQPHNQQSQQKHKLASKIANKENNK